MGKHTAKQLIPLSTRTVATILAWAMAIPPVHGGGVPPLPGAFSKTALPAVAAGTLPSGASIVSGVKDIVTDQANNRLTVTQNEARAIIDWQSFNIAANASVRFEQKQDGVAQTSWAALNRIHDLNPTQILGSLSADGKVYLINQNGILFGAGSRVDVHAIAASALNIRNDDFLNGALRFRAEAYGGQTAPPGSDVAVANEGTITAGTGGSVFLVAPEVYNSGTISAPVGKIDLVGVGTATGGAPENGEVEITEFSETGIPDVIYSDRVTSGLAVNLSGGRLSADSGRVGMYGATVRQQGIIRSVAAVKKGSEIFLAARNRVVTGAGSSTSTPISDSTEQVHQTYAFSGGTISVGGLYTHADGASGNTLQPLQRIEHHGAITAPGGSVALEAVDRVFLDSGSSIDVSGLWLDRSASDNELEVQLDSVELRDDYGQKDGILKGKKIKVDRLTGSAIGNLDNSYLGDEMSAEERSTSGGTIVIGAPDLLIPGTVNRYTLNEIIVKNGANIAFAGGGTRYAAGTMETTWLSSGGKLYSIATAPQWLTYDGVRNISTYVPARTVGSDAGTLRLTARTLVLDGTLDGHVTRGKYQTAVTPHTAQDSEAYDISVARGLEEPVGGTLTIGLNPGSAADVDVEKLYHDSVVNEIILKTQTTPLSEEFGADDILDRDGDLVADEISELSATTLSSAGLGTLGLYANTRISSEAGSSLTLLPGGNFAAKARSIEHRGAVTVAGGTVEFLLKDNITTHSQLLGVDNPLYRELIPILYFAPGSSVSVAGERVDNSRGSVRTGHADGGQIIIQDATGEGTLTGNDLVLAEGSLLDVSGGYVISPTWKVSGGDAGTLELRAMNLELAGDLRGLALQGKLGGKIRLHAGSILVGENGTLVPDATFFLADDRLQDTGFTRIDLLAINDITFAAGATLQPSFARLTRPMPGGSALGTSSLTLLPDWLVQSPDYLGETGISATAGVKIYTGPLLDGGIGANESARVTVESGSLLRTAAKGSIDLSGPIMEIGGTVSAPGGEITLSANLNTSSITIQSGAEISAAGYLQQTTDTIGGLPAGPTPEGAGSITIESLYGTVTVAAGATLDVSGSEAIQRIVKGSSGTPVRITDAGGAGSLTLSYGNQLFLEGDVNGKSHLAGMQGGSLEIRSNSETVGLILDGDGVRQYQQSGFDALTFSSPYLISLPDQLQVDVSRSLTLDTPHLQAVDGGSATLSAPWLRWINTSKLQASLPSARETGENTLTLSGQTVDLEGSLVVTGFGSVRIAADRDIRLTDRIYGTTGSTFWAGDLGIGGDLTLQARQIYPTTAARFDITGNGKVTILPGSGDDSGAVYSAGGSLTITAPLGIEHYGTLAAPMGTVTLDAGDGRVYLAEGSVISTGSTVSQSYGSYDGTFWTIEDRDKATATKTVDAVPDRGVTLSGREVVVRDGATVDVSGGGEIYATNFQASLQGSVNPLTKSGRYVIVPDGSVTLPGAAIYLEALPELGLKAGVYSILPIEYAFVPGALVVENTGMALVSGEKTRSSQGYTTIAGYATVTDTDLQPAQYTGYAVRKATDVLKEGDFSDTKTLTAGDGGSFKLNASESAVMAGSFQGAGLAGYKGGTISMSGLTVQVLQSLDALPADFDFDAELPAALRGTLQVETGSISNKGLGEVVLGDSETTTSLTVQSGAVLEASNITLAARDTVTVEDGASVTGSDNGAGSVTIDVATGTFTLAETASVTADDHLQLKALDAALGGEFSGKKRLTLASERIGFVSDGYQTAEHGIYLTEGRWSGFSGYEALNLVGSAELLFLRDVDLNIAGTLTIDTGLVTGQSTVTLGARQLNLRNSGFTTETTGTMSGGSLTLSADAITVTSNSGFDIASQRNRGDILLDGFGSVTLASGSDLTLQGVGTLRSVGDLTLSAARIRTNYYRDDTTSYRTADFTVQADGTVNITGNSFVPSQEITPEAMVAGGSLEISARSITQEQYVSPDGTIERSSTIELPGGDLLLTATGDSAADGIFLKKGANILARGAITETADPDVVDVAPGGRVVLYAANGDLQVESGALVDVSAATGNDAGSISLTAEEGNVVVSGDLLGKADGGLGGSLAIESATLDGFGGLDGVATKLRSGGFDNRVGIRSRSGDLSLAAVTDENNREVAAITARELVIAADNGSLTIAGAIDVDGTDAGGRVELYTGNALTIDSTAKISARGTTAGASGGTVILSSADGSDNATANIAKVFNGVYALNVLDGARIDVSGTAAADGQVQGGSVAFRAYQGKRFASDTDLNDVNMAALADGTIVGATRVSVEAARSYAVSGNIGTATVYTDDAVSFMAKAAATDVALKTRLFSSAATNPDYHLQAGIELDSAGNLTLDTAWDLSSIRPGGEAGILTLRAAGNLAVSANLTDHPTAYGSLTSGTMQESWGINLVAGADLDAARLQETVTGVGNLVIGPMDAAGRLKVDSNGNALGGAMVYTESGVLTFASGNDTEIGYGMSGLMINSSILYNLGSYGGTVRGEIGNDLIIRAGAIQTATGDIDLRIGGDLALRRTKDATGSYSIGTIRTTGEYTPGSQVETSPGSGVLRLATINDYWSYGNGGDISIETGGAVDGEVNNAATALGNAWDNPVGGNNRTDKFLAASYAGSDATEGIATMAGGNLTIRSGGAVTSQMGTFGTGDLTVYANGALNGRFRVMDGTAVLHSMGSFGSDSDTGRQVLEIADTRITVTSQGDIYLGAVLNPDNTREGIFFGGEPGWNLTYAAGDPDAGLLPTTAAFRSLAGSVTLYGESDFSGYTTFNERERILPPSFSVLAAGDIRVLNDFALPPSERGNLVLKAKGDIDGTYLDGVLVEKGHFAMFDNDPATIYGRFSGTDSTKATRLFLGDTSNLLLVHAGDPDPVEIIAGGDLRNLQLELSKMADISAGNDIEDLVFTGQNLSETDVTSISAGNDITYNSSSSASTTPGLEEFVAGIKVAGPGTLLVQAGHAIDLGTSEGIQSIGNLLNSSLGTTGSTVMVVAGASKLVDPAEVRAFIHGETGWTDHSDPSEMGLLQAGKEYSKLKESGDADAAREWLEEVRAGIIRTLFAAPPDPDDPDADLVAGSISMTSSQIRSLSGADDLYVLARGTLNVGKSTLDSNAATKSTGIYTSGGGAINIFSGGDCNVNESKVMTFLGGDIMIWSDQGDINAGRGSKTSTTGGLITKTLVQVSPPVYQTKVTPPSVGSGLRAVTFDPDGLEGPLSEPEPGEISLFAPAGVIDAGEAGIVGGKLTLAALEVLNSQNIVSFSGGSVGIPSGSDASAGLGSLSGTGGMTESNRMIEQVSGAGAARDSVKTATQVMDDFMAKFLDVRVISFDVDPGEGKSDRDRDKD